MGCSKIKIFKEEIIYFLAPFILIFVDYIAITVAVVGAKSVRDYIAFKFINSAPLVYISDIYGYIIFPLIFIAFIAYAGMYNKRVPFWQCTGILFKVCIYVNALVILISYLGGASGTISRLFMLLLGIFSFIFLCLFRYISKRMLVRMGLWQRPVIIVGAGKTAEIIAGAFGKECGIGYRIVGLIEDCYHERDLIKEYPHLGTFNEIEKAVVKSRVRDVIIATPGLDRDKLLALMHRIQPYVRNLTIVPDLFGVHVANIEAEKFIDDRLVLLKTKNNLEYPISKLIKRIFDLVVGGIVFILVTPILLILSIWIKIDSPGPILHIAKRIGKDKKEFYCYKFRTMVVNSDDILKEYLSRNLEAKREWETFAKLRGFDPRITKIGKWMRRFSLDELPQIINVLIGNMSLVGPRPYLPREKEDMGYYLNTICLTVPGITGLWQVSGRNNIEFAGRLQLDAWYVRNWSLWQDVVLLIKTFRVVFGRNGAY